MKRILALVLASLLLAGACASAETLRVGMECDYAPFNWTQAEPSDTAVPIAPAATPTATTCASPR